MEPTAAAWGRPLEFQLAMTTNWPGAEEAPAADGAQVWAAAAGDLPLEYASIVDIFGSSCSLQPYNYVVPASISSSSSSGGQQQVVDFNYYAAAAQQHHDMTVKGTAPQEDPLEPYVNNPKKAKKLFKKKKDKFDDAYNADFLKMKMHRYPASIRALDKDDLYTKPRVVAIGPYHHDDGEHLKQAEEVKHAAAWHCMKKSGIDDVRVLYHAVISAVVENDARRLYDEDVMAGITDDDFLPMMFYDACFLVMYMLKRSGLGCDTVLADFFESNKDSIAHDIMLLENQIPWPVVEAVMNKFESFPLESKVEFIARWKEKWLQDRALAELPRVVWDESYEPPHLLGLLRFYMVGEISRSRSSEFKVSGSNQEKIKKMKISAGAIELAEMGIQLTADETRGLPDMGLASKWIFLAELSMAPLCLNDLRASQLVNMAALEVCTTPDFFDEAAATFEDSAVCSYILLLGMLMHREADVHQLRTEGILQGAGLTNNKTLDLFTSLHCLPEGCCYAHVMAQIEAYRVTRCPGWLWVYRFIYRNLDYMLKIITVIGVLYGLYKFFNLIISAHLHHH